jgi:hypothetical protein
VKRCLFFLTLLLMMAAIVTGCGGNEASVKEEPKASEENAAVENKSAAEIPKLEVQQEMTVSLATIDGWEKSDEIRTALVYYKKEGNTVMVTRDRMPPEAESPEKFLEFVKERFFESFNNVVFHDVSEIGISDSNKHFLVYTHQIMNFEMKGWITYIFHDKYAYTLTCGGLSKDFPVLEEDFRTFIESFKLIGK